MFNIRGTDPKDPGLVSANSISNDILKGHPIFAILIRDKPSQLSKSASMNLELEQLITENQDVFPDKFPKELPPARTQDLYIELKPQTEPQKIGLYRMSQYELEEVKAKVNELLEWGYIRPSTIPIGSPRLVRNEEGR